MRDETCYIKKKNINLYNNKNINLSFSFSLSSFLPSDSMIRFQFPLTFYKYKPADADLVFGMYTPLRSRNSLAFASSHVIMCECSKHRHHLASIRVRGLRGLNANSDRNAVDVARSDETRSASRHTDNHPCK